MCFCPTNLKMSSQCIVSPAEVLPQNTIPFFDKIINLISLQIFVVICNFNFKSFNRYGMM